jgi:hypothetical protein
MDVEQWSFRSLYGIRWPVLGSVRSNVQTHRLWRLRQRTSALSGTLPFSKTGNPRIPQGSLQDHCATSTIRPKTIDVYYNAVA